MTVPDWMVRYVEEVEAGNMEAPWELMPVHQTGHPTWYLYLPHATIHDLARVLQSLPEDTKLSSDDDQWAGGIWYTPSRKELYIA